MPDQSDIPIRKPDIEFRRSVPFGTYGIKGVAYRTYGHIYWRPLTLVVLGRVLIGRKRLQRHWDEVRRDA